MRNADLERIIGLFLTAIPNVVVGARGLNGTCRFCNSPRGQQHGHECPTWGLIHARIEHHLLREGPARSSEAAPNPVEAMVTMEAGADLTPTAPALLYADGGQR